MLIGNRFPAHVGLLRESFVGERRVALTPDDVRLFSRRISIRFERGAGAAAGYADDAYIAAGGQPASFDEIASISQILVSVRPFENCQKLRRGSVLISLGGRDRALADRLRDHSVLHFDLDRLAGVQSARHMDVSSPQSAIAGHAAVVEGARELRIPHPLLTVEQGFVKPVKMIALGIGAAGLQAIATARRLGALTYGFDIAGGAQQSVEKLGAKFLAPGLCLAVAQGISGWSNKQTAEWLAQLRHALGPQLSQMQLIVTSVQVAGEPAPVLIDEYMVAGLQPGTVIVDLAAESGGNCALTRRDQLVVSSDVRIIGSTNMPSQEATEASRLFSINIRNLLEHVIDGDGCLNLDSSDEIIHVLMADQPAAAWILP
jgi:NAD/NADP transhydrogenase alpha subunit